MATLDIWLGGVEEQTQPLLARRTQQVSRSGRTTGTVTAHQGAQ